MNDEGLIGEARQFATELSATVQGLVPDCAPFSVQSVGRRIAVEQEPDTGIPLRVTGRPLLTLKVVMRLEGDTSGQYLAVESSSFVVYEGDRAAGEPLFRYDYVRSPVSEILAAHLQLHAHRDAIAYVMAQTGTLSARGKRRAKKASVPHLAELHFPLGGHPFRPCLEDLLEMLVSEFGVDCSKEGREALRRGREKWRRQQTRSVVRDAPQDAVDILRELGYRIEPPAPAPASNIARLRAL
ncbi:hypothetical protein GCM10025864_08710 [Luteimicrobium album]|uniref:Uncharacterized protein n=1 Tax=Luteimicrobium album TaxID=1054550 RepID=A0ABQ6HXI7_9MICO|nr:hypothetical protein [Luteimicrobium album]GMA23112.1 hypothetical protein GCM10025864_08710 [Luteimicrobium album]